jgi:hypothetical protein
VSDCAILTHIAYNATAKIWFQKSWIIIRFFLDNLFEMLKLFHVYYKFENAATALLSYAGPTACWMRTKRRGEGPLANADQKSASKPKPGRCGGSAPVFKEKDLLF